MRSVSSCGVGHPPGQGAAEVVVLSEPCEVCGAGKGVGCHNITDGSPRETHVGRTEIRVCLKCGRAAPVDHRCGR